MPISALITQVHVGICGIYVGGKETKLATDSIIKQLFSSNIYMEVATTVKKLISDTDDIPDHHQLIIHRKTDRKRPRSHAELVRCYGNDHI